MLIDMFKIKKLRRQKKFSEAEKLLEEYHDGLERTRRERKT